MKTTPRPTRAREPPTKVGEPNRLDEIPFGSTYKEGAQITRQYFGMLDALKVGLRAVESQTDRLWKTAIESGPEMPWVSVIGRPRATISIRTEPGDMAQPLSGQVKNDLLVQIDAFIELINHFDSSSTKLVAGGRQAEFGGKIATKLGVLKPLVADASRSLIRVRESLVEELQEPIPDRDSARMVQDVLNGSVRLLHETVAEFGQQSLSVDEVVYPLDWS